MALVTYTGKMVVWGRKGQETEKHSCVVCIQKAKKVTAKINVAR